MKQLAFALVAGVAFVAGGGMIEPAAAQLPDAPGGRSTASEQVNVPTLTEPTALDTPDPFVFKDETTGTYYAYSTTTHPPYFLFPLRIPVMTSTDLHDWTLQGDDALPGDPPPWASYNAFTWSPSVLPRPANAPEAQYVMYYVLHENASDLQCISVATSSSPAGPFVDTRPGPLVCQRGRNGSIDPSYFVQADGDVFLVWSSLDNQSGGRTRLWSRRLGADGLSLRGNSTQLLRAKRGGFEQGVVENPSFVKGPGGPYVFYSINFWWTGEYAVGVARCRGIRGPCSRVYRTPVLASREWMLGPGSPSFVTSPTGKLRAAFHAWTYPYVGYKADGHPEYPDGEGRRSLHIRPVSFPGGAPKIG